MPIDPKNQHPDGRFKKGCQIGSSGRPKRDKMMRTLRSYFGDDGKELLYILMAQIYDVDIDHVGIDQKIMDILPKKIKKKKKKSPKVDKRLACDNAKWIFDQLFGKPLQETKTELLTEKDINITIGNKKDKLLDPKDF